MEGLAIPRGQGEGSGFSREDHHQAAGRISEPTAGRSDVTLGAAEAPGSPQLRENRQHLSTHGPHICFRAAQLRLVETNINPTPQGE